ncbi:hypothetical protein K2Z83_11525 [Oscillochloris sp. ZM17-4]|uniref:hypothetical protein n=1 Tax=Oscillochloris sp. ZM17-4 TaxID=2866714 RepID=UPI001C73B940|nr:hypothetical protein [Oscillochloris sp. ZM17-4]MBX0328305.1 hypothetical protein [Oscillochloris sp. ZM17-4]
MQLGPVEQPRHERICAALRATISAYPPALRQRCAPDLEDLLCGEFSQLAALLPAWLSDLIPLDDALLDVLGEAGLWLWWYADTLDGLIDGTRPPARLPGAQQALLRALEIYRGLGLADTPAWGDLMARALLAADAYARELATRDMALPTISDEQLALWSPELLMERAAPFSFTLTAQLQLAGAPEDDPRRPDIAAALRALTAARQIADDAADWMADLARGQLNSVSAGLIRHFRQRRHDQAGALSLEQLAGYEIHAEGYWDQVEQSHAALCRQALDHLAPYGACRLRALIVGQQRGDAVGWARMRARRADVRVIFTMDGK